MWVNEMMHHLQLLEYVMLVNRCLRSELLGRLCLVYYVLLGRFGEQTVIPKNGYLKSHGTCDVHRRNVFLEHVMERCKGLPVL